MRRLKRNGFTYVEIMTVLALLGVLSVIIWARYNKSYEKALEATLVSDMRNLMTAQEIYFRDHLTYAVNIDDVRITPSPKSDIMITSADIVGYSAWNQIERTPKRCEVYVGRTHASSLGIATESERIFCAIY
jgi:prepilin-type N-terminal cleavage/methylation domain-containing protein